MPPAPRPEAPAVAAPFPAYQSSEVLEPSLRWDAPAASPPSPQAAATPQAPPAPPDEAKAAPPERTWTPIVAPAWPGDDVPAPAAPEAAPRPTYPTPAPVPAPELTASYLEASAPAPAPPAERQPSSPPVPRAPENVRRPSAPRLGGAGFLSDAPAWLVPAAIAVVVLLVLGIAAAAFLSHGKSTSTAGTSSPSTTSSPHASPKGTASPGSTQTPQAVPSFGPLTGGPIAFVQFCSPATPCSKYFNPPEMLTSCTLDAGCKVEVAIYYTAQQTTGSASYVIEFVDRCKTQNNVTELPGPAQDPLPGRSVIIPGDSNGLWAITLPAGVKSGALVAVTTTSPAVASPPLLVGSETSCA